MYSYFAYGMDVCSEISFPELIPQKTNVKIDVKIVQKTLDTSLLPSKRDEECFHATELGILRFIPNVGSFFIHNGHEIIVDPVSDADELLIKQCLLGTIFVSLLHQRGMLILHGSAVANGDKAIAFLGASGSGKSTSAAAMSTKGYSILADELVIINASTGIPLVYPTFPQINLWPDAAESLGYDLNTLPYISSAESKRAVRHDLEFSTNPFPLKRFYLLHKGVSIETNRLLEQDSMIELIRNSYALKSLKAKICQRSHFIHCAKIAKLVPMYILSRPSDLNLLKDFAYAVAEDLRYD